MNSLQSILGTAICFFSAVVPLLSQNLAFKSDKSGASLVELYTSEGCSSCPPAEAWVSKLKSSPELWTHLFPVVFHVDYWDSLGWPDRFASPAYTQRQRNYASELGQDSVYTPEFVVNGREWRGWFDGQPLPSPRSENKGQLVLSVSDNGKTISAIYSPASGTAAASYTINIVPLGMNIVSQVQRGENSGRQLIHDFVVLNFTSKPLTPTKTQSLESGPITLYSTTGDVPGAVAGWVSSADGTILQVTGGWLKNGQLTVE